jgi:hypothetical protein
MGILRPFESLPSMFQRLFGKLVSGQVIPLRLGRGGGTVRVCGWFVEFSSFLMRIIWHSIRRPLWFALS